MLFNEGNFIAASGLELPFKIECAVLTENDWACIAQFSHVKLPAYCRAVGVPKGGYKLAKALQFYADKNSKNLLIVDDVWTTGTSMRKFALAYTRKNPKFKDWYGFVAFSRGSMPINVRCFLQLMV